MSVNMNLVFVLLYRVRVKITVILIFFSTIPRVGRVCRKAQVKKKEKKKTISNSEKDD